MTRHALFTACDRNYLPGAVAMLGSARRHLPDVDRFCMVPPADQALAEETLAGLGMVLTPPRRIAGVTDRLQIAYARVFMVDQTAYDVLTWVDSDIVFCRPAPELWQVRPQRAVAVRTPDTNRVPHNLPAELRTPFRQRYPALSATPGFNSGVFALRPADWPDLQARIERLIVDLDCVDHPRFFDQPLLNVVFEDRVDLLDPIFNWTEMFDTPPDPDVVRLVHFASKPKPWQPGYPKHEPGYWFWVKHGLGETDLSVLRAVRRKILLHTPRRLLGRLVRKVWPRK